MEKPLKFNMSQRMLNKTLNEPQTVFGVKLPETSFDMKYYVDENIRNKSASAYTSFQHHKDFMRLMRTWDRGSRSVREEILKDFIVSNMGKSAPELEHELAGGGSLFLTRLSAWIRLT
jgi:hypothetical protein